MRIFVIVCLSLVTTGRASHYRPGAMEATVKARQNGEAWAPLPLELPKVDGYAAICDCSKLGEIIYLRQQGNLKWESFLVADCGGPQLREDGLTACEWMSMYGILAEVDYNTAQRWHTEGELIHVERLVMREEMQNVYYQDQQSCTRLPDLQTASLYAGQGEQDQARHRRDMAMRYVRIHQRVQSDMRCRVCGARMDKAYEIPRVRDDNAVVWECPKCKHTTAMKVPLKSSIRKRRRHVR